MRKSGREATYPGETWCAVLEDLAFRGLGGTAPPHSRVVNTTPSACYALHVFNGRLNLLYFTLLWVV